MLITAIDVFVQPHPTVYSLRFLVHPATAFSCYFLLPHFPATSCCFCYFLLLPATSRHRFSCYFLLLPAFCFRMLPSAPVTSLFCVKRHYTSTASEKRKKERKRRRKQQLLPLPQQPLKRTPKNSENIMVAQSVFSFYEEISCSCSGV